ncbi:dual specificity phosphatase, catalytic domain protein, partial [Ostertagia ostertagi]
MSRIGVFGQISEITDHLFLSGAGCLKPEKIKQKRIVFVVNATTEEPNSYIQGVEYMKVRIDDHPYARIQDYFDQVADKIKAVKDRGGKTLVHCMAGVSRSASLVMIYLVKHERMTLRQAYHYVRSARPVIRPNVGFWKQMVDFERRLRGVASVTMVMTNQCDLPIPDIYVDDLKRAQEREQLQQKTTVSSSNGSSSASSLIRPPVPVLSSTKRRGYSA